MRSLLIVVVLAVSFVVRSQGPGFINYGVEDGLLSSECYQVLQDHQGYIWIATDKGVSRFDAYSFQNYTKNNGLPENCVLRMYLDPKGRIWFVCLSGKMAIYENRGVKPLPINAEIAQKNNGGIINSIQMYRDTLRLGYFISNKTLQIVHKGDKFKLLVPKPPVKSGAYIEILPNGHTLFGWIIRSRNEVTRLNVNILHSNKQIKISQFFDFLNNYWFQAYRYQDKLYVIHRNALSVVSLKDYHVTRELFDSYVFSYKMERTGPRYSHWVGTMKGLLRFDDLNGKPEKMLNGNGISNLFRDKEGGLWVTTLNNGIYYARNSFVRNYLLNQKVYCMLNLRGRLLLGLDNGSIGFFDGAQTVTHKITSNKSGFPISKMFYLGGDQLLVRHFGNFIFSLRSKKNHTLNEMYASKDLIYDTVHKKGMLIEESGISDLEGERITLKWLSKRYNIKINTVIDQPQKGTVLLGTNLGLAEYDKARNTVRVVDTSVVNVLYMLQSGNVSWLATKEDGIQLRYDGKVHTINTRNGLTSDYCSHIFLENTSTAWISTNRGVTCVKVHSWHPFKYSCTPFRRMDGLISDEVSQICEWNNQIVAATSKGLSVWDKSHMLMPEYKPGVVLSNLTINGKNYPLKGDYHIPHAIKNVVINFKGLCYRKEGKLRYRYRFREINPVWKTTSNTSLEYNEIPYGTMTFEIQTQSTSGNWNTPVMKIVLYSPTPFFETFWFYALCLIVCFFITWGLINWRVNVVKKRAFEREQLLRKASEMELKFLTGQMNPHFTFNAMNSVQQFMLRNDLLKAQNYLTKYSKLIRKVLEHNMHAYVDLAAELELSKLYVEIESLRFSQKIDFKVACDPLILDAFKVPPMVIQPYLENAVWHGLFDETIVHGSIHLQLTVENDFLKCIIEDNGIGRERSQRKKGLEGEKQSLGMLITGRRLDHLAGSGKKTAEIVDLYDTNGKPCGTRIILYFPFLRT